MLAAAAFIAVALTTLATATAATTRGSSDSNTVTVVQGVDIETTNPLETDNTTTLNVLRHFYDTLVQPKLNQPSRYVPDLATSWRQVNPTTVRFNLHRGVRFSDGSPLDAQAVKYTVDYLLGKLPKIKKPLSNYEFPSLAGAKVVSQYVVDIRTKYPDPLLFGRLTLLFVLPNHSLDKNASALSSKPVGTGPYTMTAWNRNAEIVMKANPSYFLGRPRIENVVFKVMPDASARLAALQAGTVDLIVNVPPDNIAELKSAGVDVRTVPSDRIAFVWLNTRKPGPLASPAVRQAMNYAVDVNTIIKTVMDGYGVRVAAGVPPYFPGYSKSVRPFKYDPALAKKLLAKAGYPNGFNMTWMIPNGRYAFSSEVSQAISQYLGKVGINVKLKFMDYAVWGKLASERNMGGYDGFYAAWGENLFNPIDTFQVAVRSGSPISFYDNKSVNAMIDKAARTLDGKKQAKLLIAVQRQLLKDAPFIYLYAYTDIYGVSKRLHWQPQSDESLYMYRASLS